MDENINPDDLQSAHDELQPSPLGDVGKEELWVADKGDFAPDSFDQPASAVVTNEAKNYAMGSHLAGFAGAVFPFGNILGPLVVWLMGRSRGAFADYHGKEAVNFNISYTIYLIVAALLALVLIGLILIPIVIILWLVFTVTAAIRASNGEEYRYPMTIRFVS